MTASENITYREIHAYMLQKTQEYYRNPPASLVDDVIAQTGLTTGKLLASLTMLELKGIIQRHPGKRVSLKCK